MLNATIACSSDVVSTPQAGLRARALAKRALGLTAAVGEDRAAAEAFIEGVYQRAFGARIERHYPNLVGLPAARGGLAAAAGYRWADEEPLFLEQYLDAPIEQALAVRLDRPVLRAEIVEIGNLASAGAARSVVLFAALVRWLRARGATYAVGVATGRLRTLFAAIGHPLQVLGPADPARLSDGGAAWGDYYAHDPMVVGEWLSGRRARRRSGRTGGRA